MREVDGLVVRAEGEVLRTTERFLKFFRVSVGVHVTRSFAFSFKLTTFRFWAKRNLTDRQRSQSCARLRRSQSGASMLLNGGSRAKCSQSARRAHVPLGDPFVRGGWPPPLARTPGGGRGRAGLRPRLRRPASEPPRKSGDGPRGSTNPHTATPGG